MAVLHAAEPVRRTISECIALAEAHEEESGKAPVLDADFGGDVEEILTRRSPGICRWPQRAYRAANPRTGVMPRLCSNNSLLDPLKIDLVDGLFPPDVFEYTGTATLSDFYVLIEGALPGETFSCSSDIFTGPCYNLPPTGNFLGYDLVVFTSLPGGTGLTEDESISASVSAPEPSLMLQLLLSLLLLAAYPCWPRIKTHLCARRFARL